MFNKLSILLPLLDSIIEKITAFIASPLAICSSICARVIKLSPLFTKESGSDVYV